MSMTTEIEIYTHNTVCRCSNDVVVVHTKKLFRLLFNPGLYLLYTVRVQEALCVFDLIDRTSKKWNDPVTDLYIT